MGRRYRKGVKRMRKGLTDKSSKGALAEANSGVIEGLCA
jgi:hypothetical protein